MVTDAMLKAAATRARDAKRIFLESQMLTPRTFSPKFESRIKKVAWRADHPVLFGALRYGLAVLLIAALLLGILWVVFPEKQPELPEAPAPVVYGYQLPNAPEGYTLLQETEREKGKTWLYGNDAGLLLNFSYEYTDGTGALFAQTQNYEKTPVTLAGGEGLLYSADQEGLADVLVWKDPKTGALLRLMGHFSEEELIALAESVCPVEI